MTKKTKILYKVILIAVMLSNVYLLVPGIVSAEEAPKPGIMDRFYNAVGKGGAGYSVDSSANFEEALPMIIGRIISYILALVGVFFLILTIYGGFLWMTAGGNEDQIKKAKKYLTNAIIGLIIVLAAYSITFFVVDTISSAALKP